MLPSASDTEMARRAGDLLLPRQERPSSWRVVTDNLTSRPSWSRLLAKDLGDPYGIKEQHLDTAALSDARRSVRKLGWQAELDAASGTRLGGTQAGVGFLSSTFAFGLWELPSLPSSIRWPSLARAIFRMWDRVPQARHRNSIRLFTHGRRNATA